MKDKKTWPKLTCICFIKLDHIAKIEENNLEHSLNRPDMFPLQRGNKLVIQFSNSVDQQVHKISEDLILNDYDSPVVGYSHKKLASSRPKKIFYGAGTSHVYPNDYKEKKVVHREIERQRRKEMATLHASLRSLLPLEFIKVKKSTWCYTIISINGYPFEVRVKFCSLLPLIRNQMGRLIYVFLCA